LRGLRPISDGGASTCLLLLCCRRRSTNQIKLKYLHQRLVRSRFANAFLQIVIHVAVGYENRFETGIDAITSDNFSQFRQ
jgi:hypothetical protein